MIRQTLMVGADDLDAAADAVLCRDLVLPPPDGATLRRGQPLDEALQRRLRAWPGLPLDVVRPEGDEIRQEEGSRRLAAALVGPGLTAEPPHQGQVVVNAAERGLLRVRGDAVVQANRAGVALVATALDGRVVDADETVAIVKAAQLWVSAAAIEQVAAAAGDRPVLRVAPFAARRASFLGGPKVRPANFALATSALGHLLDRFGVALIGAEQVAEDPASIARALQTQRDRGAEIVLVAGSIVLDPGDPFLVALERLDARLTVRGAPVDPGTMFWVAYLGTTVCFGLASCEMYGRLSVLDLALPYAVAGEPITTDLFAELGYGGLLPQTFPARQSVEGPVTR